MADVIMVVNNGLEMINNRILGLGNEPKYLDWGTGATAPVGTNTALQAPGGEARVAGVSTTQTTNTTNDSYQVVGTITCETTAKAITEVGLFDASVDGILFVRGTFDPINLSVGDSIQFTIKNVLERK